jgi:hypothetical protein
MASHKRVLPTQHLCLNSLISVFIAVAEQDVVALFVGVAAAAQSAVAPFAVSVADGAAPSAAVGNRRHFVLRVAGALSPAARIAFLPLSDISGPLWNCECLEERVAEAAEGRLDAPRQRDHYSRRAKHCPVLHFSGRHGPHRLRGLAQLRGR